MGNKSHNWSHFVFIVLIFDFFILIYNSNFIDISGWFPWTEDIESAQGIFLFVLSFIFMIPICYASAIYGLRGTILTWVTFLASVLPRTISQIRNLEDAVRFALFAVVAFLLGALISLARSAERQEKAIMEELAPRRWNSVARILKAQEDERERIARELHDDSIQDLLVVANHIHAVATGIYGDPPQETREQLERIENEILQVIDDVRRMSHGLKTSVLDNTGIVPALKWVADTVSQETGIRVTVVVQGKEHRLKPEAEIMIFRIAQEALSNIRQHSRATEAMITLDFIDENFKMTVQDNGCGFVLPENIYSKTSSDHLGLDIMKQRAKLLGGKISIRSSPGEGTRITVETSM